jgi:FG-GAP-like repeat/Dockerin type I domain
MAPQSPRHSITTPTARRRRPAKSVQLRCERFEDRVTPALFNPQTALTFPLGTMNNNGFVASADFDKNGRADAVFTNFGQTTDDTTGNSIVVLYGRTTGGFTRLQFPTGGTNVSYACVADINGDTFPDLLVSNGNNQNPGSITVFRNDGAGNLIAVGTPFLSGGNNATWVGAADVTGDGVLDVVVGNFGKVITASGQSDVTGNNIAIFQGNADAQGHGNFTFSATPIMTLAPQTQGIVAFVPTGMAVGDFDGDGIVDIAAVSQGIPPDFGEAYPEGILYLFKGTGAGGFSTPNTIDTGGVLPVNIQAADINGDNKKDLIISNAGDPGDTTTLHFRWDNSSIAVFPNVSTSGSLQFGLPNILTANVRGVFATAIADYNLDGKADIAAINFGAPTTNQLGQPVANPVNSFVSVYLQSTTQAGVFTAPSPGTFDTQTGLAGGQSLAAGDFDGNGSPGLLLNTTTGQGTAPSVSTVAINNGAPQRSRVTEIKVTFSTQVNIATGAFTLKRVGLPNGVAGDNATVVAGFTTQVVGGVTVATLTFSGANTTGGSLDDGNWTLTVDRTKVTAVTGGAAMAADYTQAGIKRLFGDVNGDGFVNITDLGAFRAAIGSQAGDAAYNAALDVNGDGFINIADLGAFRDRIGSSI